MFKMSSRSLASFVILVIILPFIPFADAQNPIYGVQISCDALEEMDVSPDVDNPSIDMTCLIENTAAVGDATIEISNEWSGGSTAEMIGASGEYTVAAGGSEEFSVTFTGTKKQSSANSYDFEIIATVTQWFNLPMNEPLPQENDSYESTLQIATYGQADLNINDVSTRKVTAGDELTINLQFSNKGNQKDVIRVELSNLNELKQQGFSFVGSEFVAEDLEVDATAQREIKMVVPSDLDENLNVDLMFKASSTNDPSSDLSETNIPVAIESDSSSGSLTDGISEVSEGDMVLYGSIGGGVILLFLLIGIITRSVKKKSKSKADSDEVIEIDSDNEEMPMDEFDDLFSELDDFSIEGDEFDDLLDEL